MYSYCTVMRRKYFSKSIQRKINQNYDTAAIPHVKLSTIVPKCTCESKIYINEPKISTLSLFGRKKSIRFF